jgi:hypothetical protein
MKPKLLPVAMHLRHRRSLRPRFALRRFACGLGALLVCSVTLHAAPTIQVGSTNVPRGANFEVPLIINTQADVLGAYTVVLSYDTNILACTGITVVSNELAAATRFNIGTPGEIRLIGQNLRSLTSPTGTVAVAQISFRTGAASGKSVLRFETIEILDANAAALKATGVDGIVTVEGDEDGAAAPHTSDAYPGILNGRVVNVSGRSIEQLAPWSGPSSGSDWKNHGAYVVALRRASEGFLKAVPIPRARAKGILTEAESSVCGRR